MLRAGMLIRDHKGRVIVLMGRNGSHRWMWWGHRLKPDGRPDTNTMPVLTAKDVVAVRTQGGVFQMIIPRIFG